MAKDEDEGKCALDSSGSTFLCLEGSNIVMKMEPKVKKDFVSNLRELSLNVDSTKRKSIEDKIDLIKKDPSILDVKLPFEEVEMIGNFSNADKSSILAVKLKDSFAVKKGLGTSIAVLSFSSDKIPGIEQEIPENIKVVHDIKEFVAMNNKKKK